GSSAPRGEQLIGCGRVFDTPDGSDRAHPLRRRERSGICFFVETTDLEGSMRKSLGMMLGFLACTLASQAQPQSYPSKPVRLIASYAPGGATDVLGRLIATDLAKPLGANVVVEN